MRKLLFFLVFLSTASFAQVKICQLPQVNTGTQHDWLIKEDSACGPSGTHRISIADFISTYGLSGGGSGTVGGDLTGTLPNPSVTGLNGTPLTASPALQGAILVFDGSTWSVVEAYTATNGQVLSADNTDPMGLKWVGKVDTIYKNTSRDSIIFKIAGVRYAIKDSTGSGSTYTANSPIIISGTVVSADTAAGNTRLVTHYQLNNTDSVGTLVSGAIGSGFTPIGNSALACCIDSTKHSNVGAITSIKINATGDTIRAYSNGGLRATMKITNGSSGGSPTGPNYSLQFRDGSNFHGSSKLTYDTIAGKLYCYTGFDDLYLGADAVIGGESGLYTGGDKLIGSYTSGTSTYHYANGKFYYNDPSSQFFVNGRIDMRNGGDGAYLNENVWATESGLYSGNGDQQIATFEPSTVIYNYANGLIKVDNSSKPSAFIGDWAFSASGTYLEVNDNSRKIIFRGGTGDDIEWDDAAQTFSLKGGNDLKIETLAGSNRQLYISTGGYVTKAYKGSASLNFPNTTAQNASDLTITVTGAADGDLVTLGVPNAAVMTNSSYTAWVSAANTVTVRFNNYSSSSKDPSAGTFTVNVIPQ